MKYTEPNKRQLKVLENTKLHVSDINSTQSAGKALASENSLHNLHNGWSKSQETGTTPALQNKLPSIFYAETAANEYNHLLDTRITV